VHASGRAFLVPLGRDCEPETSCSFHTQGPSIRFLDAYPQTFDFIRLPEL
jgi:hypothetical protein